MFSNPRSLSTFIFNFQTVLFILRAGPASNNSWRKTQLETEKIGRAVEKKIMDKKTGFAQEKCLMNISEKCRI